MAENQVNEILELDTTLKVGNNIYNINAEKAGQVENSLKITEVITGEETTANKEFNGSTPVGISVVPSTGGTFTGAINVPDTSEVQPTSVLNYSDMLNKVLTEISNHSTVYEWEAEKDAFDRGELKAKLEGAAPSGICVVIGVEKDRLVFGRYNEKDRVLPAYLYICSDSGNIYYSTYDDYIKLAAESDSARKLNYYGNQTTPDTPSISYTAEDLKNKFDTIDTELESKYSDIITGAPNYQNIPQIKVNSAEFADKLIHRYASDPVEAEVYTLKDLLLKIEEAVGITCSLLVKEFDYSVDTKGFTIYTNPDPETHTFVVSKAAKATQDSAGNIISTYYQPKILTGTIDPNSSSAPAAVKKALDGAVYIRYKN